MDGRATDGLCVEIIKAFQRAGNYKLFPIYVNCLSIILLFEQHTARSLIALKENDMRIAIYILIALLALLMLLCYSLCAIASEADERAERMYKRWQDERSNSKADK